MTISASWALQKAVYAALSNDTALTTLLGGPNIHDDVPQGADFPYVTIGESEISDWGTATEAGSEHQLTLHVWSKTKSRKQTREIMNAIKNVMHDASLTLQDHILINLRREYSEARRDPRHEAYHGLIRFRAVTEPAG